MNENNYMDIINEKIKNVSDKYDNVGNVVGKIEKKIDDFIDTNNKQNILINENAVKHVNTQEKIVLITDKFATLLNDIKDHSETTEKKLIEILEKHDNKMCKNDNRIRKLENWRNAILGATALVSVAFSVFTKF